jgi:hypothetical protein
MTNYKRFITYLYFYESGKKMSNVGFARVETSDEIGKVTIHCSTKVVPSKECKVYLLKRTKSMTISKQVAVATSQNGSLDIKLSFDGGSIGGTDFNLKDTQGVVILYSKDNYIAAKWDDSNVSYHEVILLEQEEEMQQPIPKVINTPKDLDKKVELFDEEFIEAAQIDKSEVKVSVVQPKIVMVDAAEIVNLGKASEIKKVVEQKDDSIVSMESKVEECFGFENKADESKVVASIADESKLVRSQEVESMAKESNELQSQEVEDKVVESEAVLNQEVESNEFEHKTLQANEVVAEAISTEKKDEVKRSIKDIIRDNIRAEKEKEQEKVISEEIIPTDNSKVEEVPVDDTELKEEAVHAANYAVPNPNLWADHPSARAILNRFVRMYPFDDGEIAECVRLEPKDIGLLPMSAWVLGNNSFLLHSYCNFRHLLFAKKLTREGCVYLLMVPGAHNNREQQLAKMFGFENFKCSRRRSMRDGEFGYWYVTIVFD